MTMDLDAFLWAFAFLLLSIFSNILWTGFRSYLSAQPSGEMPLYLSVFKDLTLVIQISTTLHCSLVFFTCFETLSDLVYAKKMIFMTVCTVVECAHLMAILYMGCFCLVRLMCLKNIQFTEEKLGEVNIRVGVLAFCLSCQAMVGIAYNLLSTDSLNGSNAIVVTKVSVLPGT